MNVTFLTGEYPPMQGGIGDYTAHLAQHLQALSVCPTILTSRAYPATKVASSSASTDIPIQAVLSGWDIRCWREIHRFLRQYPTQILHIQYQAAAFDLGGWVNWLPWTMRRWRQRPKIVTTFHDLRIPYLFPKAGRLRWQTVLALARYSDAVICTNPEDTLTLRAFEWGTHVTEISLGNNTAVDPPEGYDRQAWRQRLGLNDQAVVLAYFGFLNESKGGETLIRTLNTLLQRGLDVYLLMIGGDIGDSDPTNQDYARHIRDLIERYQLSPHIIFTGYVDVSVVSAHLLAADMAVMPYRDGVSFRRTTLIATLSHGLPIISTTPRIPLPQLVVDQNICLVPPDDHLATAEAVIRIAKDKILSNQLSKGAKQLGERHNWSHVAAETVKVYQ